MPQPEPQVDPKAKLIMQQMAGELFKMLSPALSQMYQQTMSAMQQSLSPAGRVVEVQRANGKQQTTSPQLLAELNDNMRELIEELRKTNELADESLETASQRRRR